MSKTQDSSDRSEDIDFLSPEEEFVFGRLVDHAPARADRSDKNRKDYYVRIETEHGDIERWGVDLERALKHSLSRPRIGDEVGIRLVGREPVTVMIDKRDNQSREIGREERQTHRDQWIVERKDFLEHRQEMADAFRSPYLTVREAAQLYPELEGSALQFRMGEALAEQLYTDLAHCKQFVDHLREYLAKQIESGKPLEPVPPKDRSHPRPRLELVVDRDYSPTR